MKKPISCYIGLHEQTMLRITFCNPIYKIGCRKCRKITSDTEFKKIQESHVLREIVRSGMYDKL